MKSLPIVTANLYTARRKLVTVFCLVLSCELRLSDDGPRVTVFARDPSAGIRTCMETDTQLGDEIGSPRTVELIIRPLGSSNAICRRRQIHLVRSPASSVLYLSAPI